MERVTHIRLLTGCDIITQSRYTQRYYINFKNIKPQTIITGLYIGRGNSLSESEKYTEFNNL